MELTKINGDGIESISSCINRYLNLLEEVGKLEQDLKEKKESLKTITEQTLPELFLLHDCGGHIIESTGEKVILSDVVRANIPSQTAINKAYGDKKEELINRRDAALSWLKNNGYESIIKNEININAGKGEQKRNDILNALGLLGVHADVKETVHVSTLNATIKELLNSGIDVPKEDFNLFVGKVAKITK